jgi:hypothetical protein
LFLDFAEEALFKARRACAQVEMFRIAAEGIVAST